jgi:hypothetical protein
MIPSFGSTVRRSGLCSVMFMFVLLVGTRAARAQTYTTNFPGTENPLSEGGAWTTQTGFNGVGGTAVQKANGIAFCTQTGNGGFDDSTARLSGFGPDVRSSATIHLAPNPTYHEVELLFRCAESGHGWRGYEVTISTWPYGTNDPNGGCGIVRIDGGTFTYLTNVKDIGHPVRQGDVFSATCIGNVITAYCNDVEFMQATDSTYADGNPGIGFTGGSGDSGIEGHNSDFGFSSFTVTGLTGPVSPSITTQPASLTVAAGQTATFSVTATGTAPLSYQWQESTDAGTTWSAVGTNSPSYTTAATTVADSGEEFQVVVTNSVGSVTSASATLTVTSGGGGGGLAIDSGGGAVANFVADTDFSGGNTYTTTATIDLSAVTNPAPMAVYQTERWGAFTYTNPGLTPGAPYTVRLHFAEIWFSSSGQRLFNVAINGTPVLSNFDIVATAGAPNKATIQQFTAQADGSGNISIVYSQGSADWPKSSGLEIIAGTGGGGGIPIGKVISLRSLANNLYVCADNYGTSPLIANRSVASTWESFLVVDQGNGNVALQSQANNLFVCADNAGSSPLIANRSVAGIWETFKWIDRGNGNVAFQSLANNLYVCADNAGSSPLIANRTAIGLWETFHDPSVGSVTSATGGGSLSGSSGGSGACGATGMETLIVLGLLALRRRRG